MIAARSALACADQTSDGRPSCACPGTTPTIGCCMEGSSLTTATLSPVKLAGFASPAALDGEMSKVPVGSVGPELFRRDNGVSSLDHGYRDVTVQTKLRQRSKSIIHLECHHAYRSVQHCLTRGYDQ